jgi:RHS repeat-associated protein
LQDFRHLETYGVRLDFCGNSLFHRLKTIAYSYGPVTKNITSVWYQPGAPDQLIHYYDYDADNRLARVRTATRAWSDSVTWEEDARYHYYPHGPLARLELGAEKIQGLDYAYTLQGWMKGMNSSILDPTRDMGHDDATVYLRDVVGYGLNYYEGDYTPAGKTPFMPDITGTKLVKDPFSPALFDGTIRNLITANAGFTGKGVIQTTAYRYDALMRLKAMQVYQPEQNSAAVWKDSGYSAAYRTGYNYDANGNITDIVRNKESGSVMDNLHFTYDEDNSHLMSVYDSAGKKSTDDLDRDNNYTYDADGRLVGETQGPGNPLLLINSWTSFGRVLNINRNGKNLELEYNAFQQRAWEYNQQTGTATYYVRDVKGNALAVYRLTSGMSVLSEWPLYGSKRLGSWPVGLDLAVAAHPDQLTYVRGVKSYELTNYLDNVMAIVSDRRIPVAGGWTADIRKGQDYYPYGQRMPGRGCDTCSYRYGFNGKESDDSVKGLGNELDYSARIYDPQIGRFLSTDAYKKTAIGWSTYRFGFDNPIRYNDASGNEEQDGSEGPKPDVGSMTKYDLDHNVQEFSFLPGVSQTIETTTTQSVGTEGNWLTVGGHVKETGEFNLEGNAGPLTLEDNKIGPKVGGLSIRMGLNEREAKVEVGDSYFGIKATFLPPSIEVFQGQKTVMPAKPPYNSLTKLEQDVKTSYKTTNALTAAVVAATATVAAASAVAAAATAAAAAVVLAPVEVAVAIGALLATQ